MPKTLLQTSPMDVLALAADLPYTLINITNTRALANRIDGLFKPSDLDTGETFSVPVLSAEAGFDALLDIDNADNSVDFKVEFSGFGTDYMLAIDEDATSLDDVLIIPAGKLSRLYVTQTAFYSSNLPVLHVSRKDVQIAPLPQGGE